MENNVESATVMAADEGLVSMSMYAAAQGKPCKHSSFSPVSARHPQYSPSRPRRVALLGGAFDPPTNAHMGVAVRLLFSPMVDEVWLLPSGPRPDKPYLSDTKSRFEMCTAAIQWVRSYLLRMLPDTSMAVDMGDKLRVCDIECNLSQALGTFDLLHILRKRERQKSERAAKTVSSAKEEFDDITDAPTQKYSTIMTNAVFRGSVDITAETLERVLAHQITVSEYSFVIGGDLVEDLPSWRRPKDPQYDQWYKQERWIVLPRGGFERFEDPHVLRQYLPLATLVHMDKFDSMPPTLRQMTLVRSISSTKVRNGFTAVAEYKHQQRKCLDANDGESITEECKTILSNMLAEVTKNVPPPVFDYVSKKKLYIYKRGVIGKI